MTATDPRPEAPAAALLDVQAVARLLTCSVRHVYRMSDLGAMPAPVHVGRLIRWRRDQMLAWLAAGCPSCRGGGRAMSDPTDRPDYRTADQLDMTADEIRRRWPLARSYVALEGAPCWDRRELLDQEGGPRR